MSRAPMDPTWRLHVFGKVVPMDDLRELDRARRVFGEPGPGAGTLLVCCTISTLIAVLGAGFAIFS